jgi:hypothetical protein
MALEPTEPLTEMSTRNLPGGKGRPTRKADLIAVCEPIVQKMWEPRRLTIIWASTATYRDTFTLPYEAIMPLLNVTQSIQKSLRKIPHNVNDKDDNSF